MTTLPPPLPPLPGHPPPDPLSAMPPQARPGSLGRPAACSVDAADPPKVAEAPGAAEVSGTATAIGRDQHARRRPLGVGRAVAALVVVAATLAVIGRAIVRMGPAPAIGAAAQGAAKLGSAGVAPDPMAPLGDAPPRETFDRATAALREAQAKPTAPTQRWAAGGAFDLGKVRSAADLDRRVASLDVLAGATRDARLAGDAVLRQLQADLAAAGAGRVQRELWVAQWAAEVRLEDDRQVALAVERFLAAGRVQLQLLRAQWGRWHLDPAGDGVRFADTVTQEQFARQAARVGAAEAELNEALRRAKANARR